MIQVPWKRGMNTHAVTKLLPEWMESVFVPIYDNIQMHAVKSIERLATTTPPILCLPCAFGSVTSNFQPQFHGFGRHFEWIGIDPRGYGYSRPPERTFPSNYFEQDAQDVIRVMDSLGYDKVTILGWSAGANAGAVLASMFPDRVHRLIMVNGNAFIDEDDLAIMDKYEDISTWHPTARAEGTVVYGSKLFQAGWSRLIAAHRHLYEQQHGDLYCHHLPQIQCKTLVIGGERDPFVPLFHAEYLSERIMHSRLHVFPNGRHDVHLQDPTMFNQLIETFIHEPNDQQTQSREYVARPEQ